MNRPGWIPDIFSFRMAWRDARPQYRTLLLYSTGIIAGVAALVAILSFRNDVMLTVDDQARELLGADLEIRMNEPYPDEVASFIHSVGGNQSESIEFSSMVVYGENGETRLSQIRAIEGGFPFYGAIKTEPESAAGLYQQTHSALVDRPIMNQLELSVGDSIQVGTVKMAISGYIDEIPGESAVFSLVGPRVIVPKDLIEGTGLLQRGSRVQYKTYIQLDAGQEIEPLVSELRALSRDHRVRYETVESRKESFSNTVENLARFLGMIGFVALLLGGLGVASAIYVYIKRRSRTAATLRCLGASARQTLSIFFIQVTALGIAGAFAGAVLGIGIQQLLPPLFSDFLPFEIVQQISLSALLLGFGVGVIVSLGFALLPLLSIVSIPPMLTLKQVDFSPLAHIQKRVKLSGAAISVCIVVTILAYLIESWTAAALFTAGLIVSFLILLGTANLLIRFLQVLRWQRLSYIWRQGVANLFRPNNQTAVITTILGMGMLLIGVLYLSQEMLIQRIDHQSGDQQPDLVFYDVQSDQNSDIIRIAEEYGAVVLQNVPIVSMRLSHRNGRSIRSIREDTTAEYSRWALSREYRVTYRANLTDAETILEGEWIGEADGLHSVVPISIHEGIAEDLRVSVGDSLTFDVQGVPVETRIASIRDVDFQRPEPNFFVLFPAGVLEPAPQFHAIVLRTGGQSSVADIQQEVVRAHPNVSALDIGLVLESVRTFLDKVSLAVKFISLFSILTGLIILASAIVISRFQRIREVILLRTIGASRSQIRRIQLLEYLLLGLLACLTGYLLALGAGSLLSIFYFELPFSPDLTGMFIAATLIVILTLLTGMLNMRGLFQQNPLDILRLEQE